MGKTVNIFRHGACSVQRTTPLQAPNGSGFEQARKTRAGSVPACSHRRGAGFDPGRRRCGL